MHTACVLSTCPIISHKHKKKIKSKEKHLPTFEDANKIATKGPKYSNQKQEKNPKNRYKTTKNGKNRGFVIGIKKDTKIC